MFSMRVLQACRFVSPLLLVVLLSLLYGPALPAQDNSRTPELQKELDQVAADFNQMYRTRKPITVLLKGGRSQKQTFFGIYKKTPEGDYVQKNHCETLADTGFAPVGVAEGIQRLTVANGQIIVSVTYQYAGGPLRPCPPAAVQRLGNGIVFKEIESNGPGSWLSNEFYFTRDGRHETIRRFKGEPENDDLFAEVEPEVTPTQLPGTSNE